MAKFESLSLEVSALGETRTYHLRIAKLYNRILPGKCTAKSVKGGTKLRISLNKLSDQEWKYLQI